LALLDKRRHGAGGEEVACKDIDRLDKIAAYIRAGAFTVEDLQNPDYGVERSGCTRSMITPLPPVLTSGPVQGW
jgi:hypothetical protein